MNRTSRRMLGALLPATAFLLAGCAGTTIKSDLRLAANDLATLHLHQRTQSIDLINDSSANVRVRVIDKKKNIITSVPLTAHDRVRLDLLPARTVEFENPSSEQALVRWTLRNNDRIR